MIRFIVKSLILILIVYGIFWLFSIRTYSVTFGLSFDVAYAKYLKLDWKKVYEGIVTDLHPQTIRLSAPWDTIESTKGVYDFTDLDYEFTMAKDHHVKVLLVIGQKVPHWPECHFPEWAKEYPRDTRQPELLKYVKEVVTRYKNNPALELWQVENEPFISFTFGECSRFDTIAVAMEIDLVRKLDTTHKILVTDSGELSTWYPAAKSGDLFGTTLYRVVRDPNGMIWKYDWLPAAFYKMKAKLLGLNHDNFFVAELQAEPWFLNGGANDNTLEQQKETFDINRFEKNISYAQHLGASRAYLWGAEWWYWMKEKQDDASYWDYAKNILK
jgi:hypothetical protein